MAEREYFPCYHSYLKKCEKLTDQELGRLFRALMEYSVTGERQELAGRESIAFDFIADDIDRANGAYLKKCEKNSQNGKRGGRPEKRPVSEKPNGFEKSQSKDKSKDKSEKETSPPDGGEAKKAPVNATAAAVCADFLDRVNATASQSCLEELAAFAETLGEAVCKRAFDIALDAKKATWPYIRAILQDKQSRGVKCLADWDAAEKTRQTGTGKGDKAGMDFQPDAARIQKNADWLDSFLAEHGGGGA